MFLSHHVGTGSWTLILWKSRYLNLLSHSSRTIIVLFLRLILYLCVCACLSTTYVQARRESGVSWWAAWRGRGNQIMSSGRTLRTHSHPASTLVHDIIFQKDLQFELITNSKWNICILTFTSVNFAPFGKIPLVKPNVVTHIFIRGR